MTHRSPLLLFLALLLIALPGAPQTLWADDAPAKGDQPKVEPEKAEEAQAPKRRPLLWMVEGSPRVFLYGTIHIADARVTKHLPVVQAALDQSTALYTELRLDMAGQMQMQAAVMSKARMTDQTLADVLGEELHARVGKALGPGMPLMALSGLKPWVVQFLLMRSLVQEHAKKVAREKARDAAGAAAAGGGPEGAAVPLDPMLYRDAQKAGKKVGGLETIDTQIDVFDSLSLEAQTEMVASVVSEIEKLRKQAADAEKPAGAAEGGAEGDEPAEEEEDTLDALSQMLDMWLAGDDQAFLDLFEKDLRKQGGEEADRFVEGLLDNRNIGMVLKLLHLMVTDPKQTYFIAVGAGHMPGELGMVNLLRRAGFTVRRIEADTKLPALPGAAKAEKPEKPAKAEKVEKPEEAKAPAGGG